MFERITVGDEQPAAAEDLETLLRRTREGDPAATATLRSRLDAQPGSWEQAGDLARIAEGSWIELIAGPDTLLRESLEKKVVAMKDELAGASPSPLETLLVARVVATWLQAYHADAAVAQAGDVPLRLAAFAQKRQDTAHRRHLAAIAALAGVRRALKVGGKPVDTAAEPVPPPVSTGEAGSLDPESASAGPPDPDDAPPLTVFDAGTRDQPATTCPGRARKARRKTAS